MTEFFSERFFFVVDLSSGFLDAIVKIFIFNILVFFLFLNLFGCCSSITMHHDKSAGIIPTHTNTYQRCLSRRTMLEHIRIDLEGINWLRNDPHHHHLHCVIISKISCRCQQWLHLWLVDSFACSEEKKLKTKSGPVQISFQKFAS